jgi:hypothetical protein
MSVFVDEDTVWVRAGNIIALVCLEWDIMNEKDY